MQLKRLSGGGGCWCRRTHSHKWRLTQSEKKSLLSDAEGADDDEQDKAINTVVCGDLARSDREMIGERIGRRAQDMIITFGIVIIYSLQKGDAGKD